ncbi:class I SAM-dependent methyltransferase [Gracilibacillus marinus]|uniref:Class I SAM-dependent methyltransferase n=1 Tax=Gracilibacillus marinus TaxID=630535 RepID=A0ABV8VYK0_9BACI
MNERQFYDMVGLINGWDFSQLQVEREDVCWDFYDEVSKRVRPDMHILDIGVGSGEKLLEHASLFRHVTGIDQSEVMIQKAEENKRKACITNSTFLQMEAETLDFLDNHFDMVTCRHAPFHAEEVFRVLCKDGIFLTQQVSEADKLNIKKAFGRGQGNDWNDGELMQRYCEDLKNAGFAQVDTFTYDAKEYYKRQEDLLYLLEHTPIIPDFRKYIFDEEIFNQFVHQNQTSKGILTNEKRFMIIARK